MYHRGNSPILDIPDFPALRRVKPLPKRRRTHDPNDPNTPVPDGLPSLGPLQMPGPDATAEELLAHAEQLSAQMALQSYYMPILGGVQDLLRNSINGHLDDYTSARLSQAISLGVDFAAEHAAVDRAHAEDEDERQEGDFMDHLSQPGNTKKRKVPTNMTGSRHQDPSSGDDDGGEVAAPSGTPQTTVEGSDAFELSSSIPSSSSTNPLRKGKLSAVTRAGLKHKEMLKTRKRQLAAVLGALSLGDPLALDQALSANYPASVRSDDPKQPQSPPIRLSRRRGPRIARAIRKLGHPDRVPLPECEFTFTCESSTSKRVIATKEEVAMLRSRFEAELARQAAKAAKLAAASKSSTASRSGRLTKRDRARARPGRNDGHQNAEFLDPNHPRPSGIGSQPLPSSSSISSTPVLGTKARGKKKKRSALANASNPHHLRNYVPSRLPHSGASSTHGNQANELGPLPLRFLSADLAPSKKHGSTTTTGTQLTNPADEWVCAYCEYELFFGDENDYRRAIRNRKKILKRRRRARERAAAAASGQRKNKAGELRDEIEDEDDEDFEDEYEDEHADYGHSQPQWRDDKGGGGASDQGAFG